MVTVVDPHRPGHELSYYPGEVTLRLADIVVINKIDSASLENIEKVKANLALVNPEAVVVSANSTLTVTNPEAINNKRVLVVEDGPTLTHGDMKIDAGVVAAQRFGSKDTVDPRPFAVGKLEETFKNYPNIGKLLPAMGYGQQQIKDLAETINKTDCDSVVIATPIDLQRIIKINKPCAKVEYALDEIGSPNFDEILTDFVKEIKK